MANQQLSTNTFGPAKFIVTPAATPWLGTHTTISSAITSAHALGGNQTIAILPGTYTENPALQAGINLTAWGCDSSQGGTGSVIISGKLSFSSAGTINIYGIQLQTNGDYCVEVTGSAASRIELTNCYINCTNNTGLHLTSSGTGSYISCLNCNGDIGTTGISLFTASSGSIFINDSFISNSGGSSTSSSASGTFGGFFQYSVMSFPFTSTSSGTTLFQNCFIGLTNATAITSSAGTIIVNACLIQTGTSTAVVINSPGSSQISLSNIASSNASVMSGTGGGNLSYNYFPQTRNITFTSFTNSAAQGVVGIAPFVGAIGETLPATGNPTLTTTVTSTVATITLTPGTWSISGIVNFIATTGTSATAGISTNTTFVNQGDQYGNFIGAFAQVTISIPSSVVTVLTNTAYNLLANATFVAAGSCFGRISAVRSG